MTEKRALLVVALAVLALVVGHGSAAACSSSEGYAWNDDGPIQSGEILQEAREVASALCDMDSDDLNFAGLVTVTFWITKDPKTVVQVSSLRLAEVLKDPDALENLAVTYGGGIARKMGELPVFVQFFHLRADGGGTVRATLKVILEGEEVRAERTEAARTAP